MVRDNTDTANQLQEIIDKGLQMVDAGYRYGYINRPKFNAWCEEIVTVLRCARQNVPEYVEQIKGAEILRPKDIKALCAILQAIKDQHGKGLLNACQLDRNCEVELENLFNKFHKVAQQLRKRHNSRNTLEICDEYDVQDLLHALLRLFFDDIRSEEWTPSYAGGSARMDFLLKDEGIVVEVKKTRKSMTAKLLGEELLIDREKYKSHRDCQKMYCFVYDPEGLLENPNGIKKDLEDGSENFIKVFIRPE